MDDPASFRTQYHNALHTARLEAAHQYDDVEIPPTNPTKRSVRPSRALPAEYDRQHSQRSSRQLPPQTFQQRTQRASDFPPYDFPPHAFPDEDVAPTYRPAGYIDPETEYLSNQSPQTGPVRPPLQTGPFTRRSHLKEQRPHPKSSPGIFKKPLCDVPHTCTTMIPCARNWHSRLMWTHPLYAVLQDMKHCGKMKKNR